MRSLRVRHIAGRIARFVALGFVLALPGCGVDPGLEDWPEPIGPAVAREIAPREPCAHRDSLRRPFYGDLHVHTGVSMDARSLGTTTTPDDAYRYARGEAVALSPFDAGGNPDRVVRLGRPLDFAAVTDHAEWMAETAICRDPDSEVYDTRSCRIARGEESTFLATLLGLKSFRAQLLGVVSLPSAGSLGKVLRSFVLRQAQLAGTRCIDDQALDEEEEAAGYLKRRPHTNPSSTRISISVPNHQRQGTWRRFFVSREEEERIT